MSKEHFSGFAPHDFDAYVPEKWRSNVFNLERMRVKDKLLHLADAVSPLYPAPDAAPLAVESSIEHPALWNQNQVRHQAVYFLRSESERRELFSRITRARPMASLLADPSPYREHIHLAVQVDAEGLSVALQLFAEAAVDRENGARKLGETWHRQGLRDRLDGLDGTFQLSLMGSPPQDDLDADARAMAVKNALDASGAPPVTSPSLSAAPAPPLLRIAVTFPRSDERLASSDLLSLIKDRIAHLLPLYAFFAWSRANDFLAVKKAIREEKKAKRQRGLAPGEPVRVIRGLFAGKRGAVAEIDSRGGVRVRIGTMVVKLAAEDITPAR